MNQTQRLIDSIRDAPHDAVIVAGMFAISALIALWIVNRMRHPERGLLHALVIASVGFVLVPCVSSAVLILWVRTGGDSIQAAFVSIFVFVFGFWGFRRWLRSAPRAARPAKALVAPAVHAAPQSGLVGEVAELRAEVARLRAVPDDLRLITLKYDSDCDACGTTLHAGEQAYWSPSARGQAWCQTCGPTPHALATGTDDASPRKTRRHGPRRPNRRVASDSHDAWSRLCRYLSNCVLAESANTLVMFQDLNKKGFLHDTEAEHLVSGDQDWTPVPMRLGRHLDATGTTKLDAAFIYGWPVLVARNQKNYPVIAPLFKVSVCVEQRDSQWIGAAKSEPEFNLAIVAGELFDMSAKEAIEALVGEGLPFGDAAALVQLARNIAEVLDVGVVSALDPQSLHRQCDVAPGVYNAAMWILANDGGGASQSLREELDELACRQDWTTTAAAYLVPDRPHPANRAGASSTNPLAAPLPCNGSQESALDRFRRKPVTIVTGPPGTGKTQLVVNAVTNAWLDGDTVLVASTNNGAVKVAADRANEDIGPGTVLRTGNRKQREALADRVGTAVGAAAGDEAVEEQCRNVGDDNDTRAELARTASHRARLLADVTAVAELNRKLAETVEDQERHAQRLWKRDRAPDLDIPSRVIERRARRVRRTWFFRGARTRRLLTAVTGEHSDTSLDDLARWAALDQTRTALMETLSETEGRIGDPDASLRRADADWAAASMTAVKQAVWAGFSDGKKPLTALSRVGLGGTSLAKAIRGCLPHARGWACTALSMRPNFRLERGLFDLVIIDEASQCSLATALPLAYRAKRLAVIGDPHQLTPVVTLSDAHVRKIAANERFDNDDLARRGIHHKEGSAYLAFEHAVASEPHQPMVLDEHYRCHPHIARWFNRVFYGGSLTVLTSVTRMPSNERRIGWIDVRGEVRRGGAGSWTNIAEAEVAVRQIAAMVRHAGRSVGVVTPFSAQAALIQRLASRDEQLGEERLAAANFCCGTAHRFQGGERDTIVFSAVLTPAIPQRTAAWVEREKNLINVAVSRAKQSLFVLGHPEIDAELSPTLASLRSYLRHISTDDDDDVPAIDEIRTDSQAEARLLDAMRDAGFQPRGKLYVEGYELDFALQKHGLQLNVEVDGDHHVDARGKLRRQDLARDRILAKIGWEVIRIPAWRCSWDVEAVIRDIRARLPSQ